MSLRYSLLIVESDHALLDAYCRRFIQLGYGVTGVHHPRQALEAASFKSFDAVIVQYHLAEMNGIQLTRKLERLVGILPTIVLFDETGLVPTAAEETAGPMLYLKRTTSTDKLAFTLEKALGGRHRRLDEGETLLQAPRATSSLVR